MEGAAAEDIDEPAIIQAQEDKDLDMGESDYFSEPKFDSVVDRYYTRLYKRVTPAMISTMLEMKESEEQLALKENICLDQFYFIHSNKLVLFGLSPRHEAIVNNSQNPITGVSFDANKKQRSQNKVTGKSKSGGTRLDPRTIVCEISTQNGKVYKVRSFVGNAYLIEMNQRVVQNPQLLAQKCESDGYLGIFIVKRGEEIMSVEREKDWAGFLSKEEYEKVSA
ncbi:hypothetical protein FGO68_gene1826 [Halteria grandinella]|uniref:Protein Abitram n=1 Tax=Halteria grandinella TaxID=5974 RepID=A0A8J8NJL3_HALGN|nr:hypothetical protein FGO68_gene1826 [Halteria grandinella]